MREVTFKIDGQEFTIEAQSLDEAWIVAKLTATHMGHDGDEVELVDEVFYSDGDDDTEDFINGHYPE